VIIFTSYNDEARPVSNKHESARGSLRRKLYVEDT